MSALTGLLWKRTVKTIDEIADGYKSASAWIGDLPVWLIVCWTLEWVSAVLALHP